MMRILVTNDDGINAPGLRVLEAIAAEVAGPSGEVWTIAPDGERSGVGHCINYLTPTLVTKEDERRFSLDGYPADCVLAGVYELMDEKPDLVLAGVNRGNNSGENAVYSGTVGAAMEAALQGIPGIALSQFFGPGMAQLESLFEAAEHFGTAVVQSLLDDGLWRNEGYRIFYNVNFPPVSAKNVRGVRIANQAWRGSGTHTMVASSSPSGRQYLWVSGKSQATKTAEGSDVAVNLDGYISITPVSADLTHQDAMDRIGTTLNRDFGPPHG